ncbi:MAG: S8 family peptidase [Bacteroidetes bacterium]|nr:S8 family peptidase [Bacteroidota bacterium]
MKKWGIASCCVLLFVLIAGNATATQWAFRITFANKNGTLDLNNPTAFLSQRALDRRSAHGIAVDSADLPVSPVYINDVLATTSGVLHVTSRWLNDCVVLLTDSSKISLIQNKPYVTSVKYIAYYAGNLHNKPAYTGKFAGEMQTAAAKGTGQPGYYNLTWNQTTMVHGDCLHDQGFKGQNKLIAVLDEGFTDVDTHPGFNNLRQSGRLLETWNFVHKFSNVYGYSLHGTSALSTIAGEVPNTFIGSAPQADYVLYITEDTQTEQPIEMDNMVAAAERADSIGADIITSSLGYNIFTDFHAADLTYADLNGVSTIAARGANMAVKKGIFFVITAGNEGGDSWNYILTPGDADSALTVGAVDPSKNIASFSGYGPNSAGITKPDICSQGDPANVFTGSGNYTTLNGTSFSTPQIAGWAACLLQAYPQALPYQLRKSINSSADHYNNPGVQIGYGIPDFCTASTTLGQLLEAPLPLVSQDWITIYPTYVGAEISLSLVTTLTTKEIIDYSLTDISGHILQRASFSPGNGRVSTGIAIPQNLPAGVYIFHAAASKGTYMARIIKY